MNKKIVVSIVLLMGLNANAADKLLDLGIFDFDYGSKVATGEVIEVMSSSGYFNADRFLNYVDGAFTNLSENDFDEVDGHKYNVSVLESGIFLLVKVPEESLAMQEEVRQAVSNYVATEAASIKKEQKNRLQIREKIEERVHKVEAPAILKRKVEIKKMPIKVTDQEMNVRYREVVEKYGAKVFSYAPFTNIFDQVENANASVPYGSKLFMVEQELDYVYVFAPDIETVQQAEEFFKEQLNQ